MKDTLETFVKKAIIKHNNKYDYSNVVYVNSKTKITVICKKHGEFKITPSNHLFGTGCKQCNIEINRKDIVNFIKESHLIHGLKYNYDYVEYKSNKVKIKIICIKHGEFLQTPKNHLSGHGCPNCACEIRNANTVLTINKFIEKANIKHNNFYKYNKTVYINNRSKIIVNCPHHGDFIVIPYQHLSGVGCKICNNCERYTTDTYIKKANLIHKNKYDYSLTDYINSQKKINIICKNHGVFKQKASNHLRGVGCPACNESKGERIIRNYFIDNKIDFIAQKKFNNCFNKETKCKFKFDFFIPDINFCIEFDGIHHFKPIEAFGGIENLNRIKKFDIIKNNYCKENNIGLLRIKYNQNIIKKLDKLFNKIKVY